MKEIIMATKNKGKVEEFRALFHQYGIEVKSLLDFEEPFDDIEETGTTFHENAQLKAETISRKLGKIVLADDSGLMVDALNGEPGVYSARYAGEPTDDRKNNEKLLHALSDVKERGAKFVCVLACTFPNGETIFAEGECKGTIGLEPKGENGFGYDPIFLPQGYDQTMAELPASKKNQLSHRFHALKAFENILQQNNVIGDKHV